MSEDISQSQMKMILSLRQHGVTDHMILDVMEKVRRDIFVSPYYQEHAYDDIALPLDCEQTISQPTVVGVMLQALNLGRDKAHKVLEIGTGTGYNAVLLSYLARRVYSIERHRHLYQLAQQNIELCQRGNVTLKWGDGRQGWGEQTPFKRIIITAATPRLPSAILDQLDDDGVLVYPKGNADEMVQDLVRVVRTKEGDKEEILGQVRFVPLCYGVTN